MRVRMELAYDGADFYGWARQPDLRTVQGELEAGVSTALRVPIELVCAGRTDTGVHARGQVVHFDVDDGVLVAASGPDHEPFSSLRRRLNGILPADVRIRRVQQAPEEFDARFGALARTYCYRICDDDDFLDPIHRHAVVAWSRPLDVALMHEAAGLLTGEHDFVAFCKRREGATTVREITAFRVERVNGLVQVWVTADAFCHHMVRSLVGALVSVGEGKRAPQWVLEVLAVRQRSSVVSVMPARGLTLESVTYPPDHELLARISATRQIRQQP